MFLACEHICLFLMYLICEERVEGILYMKYLKKDVKNKGHPDFMETHYFAIT